LLSMVCQAARLPALYHAFVLCIVAPQHSTLLHIASMPSGIALSRRRCAGSLACLGVAHWLPALPAPSLASGSPIWDSAGSLGCSCYDCCACHARWAKKHKKSVLLRALRYVCKRGAHGPSLRSQFWHSLHIFSLVHRHLPCKGWDVVGASHPFLFVSGQPSRLFVRLPSTDNASSSCT
jgi:hypothetical protein